MSGGTSSDDSDDSDDSSGTSGASGASSDACGSSDAGGIVGDDTNASSYCVTTMPWSKESDAAAAAGSAG